MPPLAVRTESHCIVVPYRTRSCVCTRVFSRGVRLQVTVPTACGGMCLGVLGELVALDLALFRAIAATDDCILQYLSLSLLMIIPPHPRKGVLFAHVF